ncbi:MAG: PIN domain-containing protein [Treponemataceae bacterium]|nr:PIN domain-containing protein [Treponemataceae bacterium]
MNVLFDTNVLLDVLLSRKGFAKNSLACMELAEQKRIKGFVSASAITDVYYIMQKAVRDREVAIDGLRRLLRILGVLPVDRKDIGLAVSLGWKDFEDSVQYAVARRRRIACILTRDKDGFALSDIPVLSPDEFLAEVEHN